MKILTILFMGFLIGMDFPAIIAVMFGFLFLIYRVPDWLGLPAWVGGVTFVITLATIIGSIIFVGA